MVDSLASDVRLGGRYRLLRQLAYGGMAAVWEAEDAVLGRRVAVKVLHPHLAVDETIRERFRREAVALARLTHPAVVNVYDTGDDGGHSYLVMELVEGESLRDVLDRRGPLPVREATHLAAQVADGLGTAHASGIVHRDVKPGNILVLPDGRAKLTDFGIARGEAGTGLDDDLTRVGTVVGTPRYLAPEQREGGPVDARTDVYALGAVLYEMLCGHPPSDAGGDRAPAAAGRGDGEVVPPRQLRAEVPRPLEAVVMRALARDPAQRFPSGTELRDALLALGAHGLDTTPESIPLTPAADRRLTAGVVGVVTVALGVALAGWFFAGTEAGRSVLGGVREQLAGSPEPLPIREVIDFDPFGDGSENPDLLPLAHDGDPSTAWRTDSYHAPASEFGNLKPGLGLVVRLEGEDELRRLTVHTFGGPWNGEVYVAREPAPDLGGWGAPVAVGETLDQRAVFDLRDRRGGAVLLWITRLPPSGQLSVVEVDVRA